MGKSFKIGSLIGIPIKLHWSFFLILGLAFVVYPNAELEFQLMYSAFVLLLFVCVTLHELGHALAAKFYGVKTMDIILSPIGGVARLTSIPSKPLQEFVIAIAGHEIDAWQPQQKSGWNNNGNRGGWNNGGRRW